MMDMFPETMLGPETGIYVCKWVNFSSAVSHEASAWTISAMTFDRFLAVRWPLQAAVWCTRKRARITLFVLFIISVILSTPVLLVDFVPPETFTSRAYIRGICIFDPEVFLPNMQKIQNTVDAIWMVYLPFCTISIFNTLIVVTLIQQARTLTPNAPQNNEINYRRGRVKQQISMTSEHPSTASLDKSQPYPMTSQTSFMTSNSERLQYKNKQTGHITVILFMVTAIFFLTNIPWAIYDFVVKDMDQWNKEFTANVATGFLYSNSSVNFYVYCLGCKRFRREVKLLLCCRKDIQNSSSEYSRRKGNSTK
jgi:hypothetical protein